MRQELLRSLLMVVLGVLAVVLLAGCGGEDAEKPVTGQQVEEPQVEPPADGAGAENTDEESPDAGVPAAAPVIRARAGGAAVETTLNAAMWNGPTGVVERTADDGVLTSGRGLEVEARETIYLEGYPEDGPTLAGVSIRFWEQGESGPVSQVDGVDVWERAVRVGNTLDGRATANPRFTVPLGEGACVAEVTLSTAGGDLVYAFPLRVVLPPISAEDLASFGAPAAVHVATGESASLAEVGFDSRRLPPRWTEFIWWHPSEPIVAQADARGLWLTTVQDGVPELVFPHDGIRWAAWHPEGDRLAVGTSDGVFVVGVDGSVQQVWLDGADFAWSREGRLALFTSAFELIVLDGEAASTTVIPGQCGGPRWVGADRIALTCGDDAFWGVVLVEGGEIVARLDGAHGMPYVSPDGAHVAVQRVDQNGTSVALYDIEGNVVRETEGVVVGSSHSSFAEQPWSPDGQQLVVMEGACSDDTRLVVWSVEGDREEVWRSAGDNAYGFVFTAVWSPDGATIAFTTPPSFTQEQSAWVVASDGSGEARVVADASAPLGSHWSGDGEWLAYWPLSSGGGYDWCV